MRLNQIISPLRLPLRSITSFFGALILATPLFAADGNDAPVAGDDTVVTRSTGSGILLSNLLDNDFDPEGDALRIVGVGGSAASRARVQPNGRSILFTPGVAFKGLDTFQYVVQDTAGNLASATVSVINPFIALKGVYAGPLTGQPSTVENSGYIQVNVSGSGAFTAQVRFGGASFSVKNSLALDGTFQGDLTGSPLGRFRLSMNLATSLGKSTITGAVTRNGVQTPYSLPKNLFKPTNPPPFYGRFTVKLPASGVPSRVPQGFGFASIRIDKSGNATIVGTLGDTAALSAGRIVLPDGSLPMYTRLYAPRRPGMIYGSLTFTPRDLSEVSEAEVAAAQTTGQPLANVSGTLLWIKPLNRTQRFFPLGFEATSNASGSSYVTPSVDRPPLNVVVPAGVDPNVTISFDGGGLFDDRTQRGQLRGVPAAGPYFITIPRGNRLRQNVKVDPLTGIFRGTYIDSRIHQPRLLVGVFIQSENRGVGHFRAVGITGPVSVIPDQPVGN